MKSLCDNPRISSANNYGKYIYVFRNGKFWKLDNNAKQMKPFGSLLEGGILASNEWTNITLPAAITQCNNKLVVINNNYWSEWSADGKPISMRNKLNELKIEYREEPDGSDLDGGTLIPIGGQIYAKLNKEKVCYVMLKKNQCYWHSSCVSLKEEELNLPKNIIAVITPKDNNWYFIDKNRKYCKRDAKSSKPVIII